MFGLGLLFAGLFALVYLPAIELEEQHLMAILPGYAAFAERVPLLVPRWPNGSARIVSRRAISKEPRI